MPKSEGRVCCECFPYIREPLKAKAKTQENRKVYIALVVPPKNRKTRKGYITSVVPPRNRKTRCLGSSAQKQGNLECIQIYASVAPPSNRKTWKAYVPQQFRQETGKLGKYKYLGSSAKKKENLEYVYIPRQFRTSFSCAIFSCSKAVILSSSVKRRPPAVLSANSRPPKLNLVCLPNEILRSSIESGVLRMSLAPSAAVLIERK